MNKESELTEPKIEYTFAMIKPNGVKNGLVGVIRQELIEAEFEIIGECEVQIDRRQSELMYRSFGGTPQEHQAVKDHIVSRPSYFFLVRGVDVIKQMRAVVGCTAWKDRPASGLRGKYAFNYIENTVHSPDSHKEAAMEIMELGGPVAEKILRTRLADEFFGFLTDQEGIEKGKRYVNAYAK